MKNLLVSIVLSLFVTNVNIYCQDLENITNNEKSKNWYLQFDNDYCGINEKVSSTLGFNIGYKFNQYLSAGISLNGIWYDHRLNELDPVKTYHIESGYSTIFVEASLPLTERFDLTANLMSGQGLMQLKYDTKYQDELKWDEELIDRTDFSVIELKLGGYYSINNNLKIGVNTALRATSEIYLESIETDFLNNVKYGFSIKYSIF